MRSWAVLLLVSLPACFAPPGPMERLNMSAYDLNTATRFGRMDVALEHVAQDAQVDFMARHAKWGRGIRVVDVELSGLRILASDQAEVTLTVTWHRIDESLIRASAITQMWKNDKNGWKLGEELRVSGSPGIFDRPAKAKTAHDGSKPPRVDLGQL
ncbi:MAG: hypothetical protein R3B72_27970 [Polyangiaceae bacterium]